MSRSTEMRWLPVVLLALLPLAGCGGSTPAQPAGAAASVAASSASTPTPTTSTPPAPSTPSPAPSSAPPSATPSAAASNCLFTVPQISRVLGGRWKRQDGDQACAYTSDRGAILATNTVDRPVASGLQEARDACVPGIRPISAAHGGFVCVERHAPDPDLVVGNTTSGGTLWIAVIVVAPGGKPTAELKAMLALMNAVPR